jgi:phage terminase large subunit
LELRIPKKLLPLARKHATFKVAHGGRGSAKSWSFARLLIIKAYAQPNRLILCAREFQASIADSVHALLKSQITAMGLDPWFEVLDTEITCRLTKSRFIFKGLRRNINEIKSTEGITDTWVEEAQAVSESSWIVLIPTVLRTPQAEIWITFNPVEADDPTFVRYIVQPPPNSIVIEINWSDNPWFPPEMEAQRAYMLRVDPDAYDWVWEGKTRHVSSATIFRGRFKIEPFATPDAVRRFLFGADWGFATDPSVLLRMWRSEDVDRLPPGYSPRALYIDQEAFGFGTELDDLPALFAGGQSIKTGAVWPGIPEAKRWPIKADSSRPETISYMRRQEFNISAAKKWPGSVEDGIEFLKAYETIYIHPRCVHMAQEARLYSYKVDEQSGDVLPIVEDRHNHGWDAVRYAHDGHITAAGALGSWQKLAKAASIAQAAQQQYKDRLRNG